MKRNYTDIKFENLEFKNTLNESEIDPVEKARVDDLIEQLNYEVNKICKRLQDEGSMITDWLDQYGDPEIEKIVNDKIMKNEFRRMQELAGVPVTSPKTNLKENFVGMGAINNPFAKSKKTDYELAFERYSNTLNEEKPSPEMFKNIKEEEENGVNPVDTIMMDVPLFIRMLEYAREDASTDMDLHDVAEKAVTLSAQGEPLNMDSYEDLIGQEGEIMENVVTENSYSAEGYSIFNSEYDDSIGIAHDSAEDTMVVLSLDPNVDFGETAVDNGTIKLGNKLVYWAVTTG
jgi:hypothetical protein